MTIQSPEHSFIQNSLQQICNRCVMDTSDPLIQFNELGICNHCQDFDKRAAYVWHPNEMGAKHLKKMVEDIKHKNKHKKYDCIIGLSGGIDSSYLAYWAVKEAGLRLLAVHVDGGWNTEAAVNNIEKIVKTLNIDLATTVVDWEIMRDLQVAFLKAGVSNQDTPQDHAFFAGLYNFAIQNNIQTILSGYNFATESVLPKAWGYSAMDFDQIKHIHQLYGKKSLGNFPRISFLKNYIYYPYIKRLKVISPLNYMDYQKDKAIGILEKELGWKYYGGKHFESRFTKFFQSYWLPVRFGYDKRKAHLSSLILSNQMTRLDALRILEQPPFDEKYLNSEKEFIYKKLNLTEDEFNRCLMLEKTSENRYKTNRWKMKLLDNIRILLSLPRIVIQKILKKILPKPKGIVKSKAII